VRWWLLVSMLAGCHVLFPRDETGAPSDALPSDDGPIVGGVDEDQDTKLDSEDNCPGIKNTTQTTNDDDSVGDACDPYPSLPGDRIAAREMFSTGFGDVSFTGTDVRVADGSAETGGAAADVLTTLSLVVPGGPDRFGATVEVGFSVLELGDVDNELRVKLTGSQSVNCVLSDDDLDTSLSTAIFNSTMNVESLNEVGIDLGQPQRMVVGAHEQDGSFCTFDGVRVEGFGTARGDVTVTIDIRAMKVRVDYIVVYDTTRAEPAPEK
jgi:hypothetical protein